MYIYTDIYNNNRRPHCVPAAPARTCGPPAYCGPTWYLRPHSVLRPFRVHRPRRVLQPHAQQFGFAYSFRAANYLLRLFLQRPCMFDFISATITYSISNTDNNISLYIWRYIQVYISPQPPNPRPCERGRE